jgi:hypothetical protein
MYVRRARRQARWLLHMSASLTVKDFRVARKVYDERRGDGGGGGGETGIASRDVQREV